MPTLSALATDERPLPSRERPVAVLLSRFPSVTETFILREVVEMERQGQRVVLVPMLRESPPVVHDAARPWMQRALFSPFVDRDIAAANLRTFAASPLRYAGVLARLAAGTVTSPATLLRTLAIFPKAVWLASRLQEEGVRHMHAHFATHPATMALVASRFAPVSFSFTVHAHDIQLDRSLLRWKLREARFVRSISEFNRRFLERLYPEETRGRIEVIHVGIDPEAYTAAPLRNEVPSILCVAAHKPYKGLPVLIDACRILRRQGVRFRCEIVGDGPMHRALEARIRRHGLQDSVVLAGACPEHEVAEKMSAASIVVLPSVIAPDGQMEGIPVALMEAMAAAKPVVSTRISGIPELIEDGVSGLLVEPGDAKGLAAAIGSLVAQPALAASLGAAARRKVRAGFTLRECVSQLLARLEREAQR